MERKMKWPPLPPSGFPACHVIHVCQVSRMHRQDLFFVGRAQLELIGGPSDTNFSDGGHFQNVFGFLLSFKSLFWRVERRLRL